MSTKPLIAIIDDDESVREALWRLVRSLGLSAQAFASSRAFLAAFDTPQAACLILDIDMPGMSGLELHRHLLELGWNIPTVLISGNPDDQVRAQTVCDGMIGCLAKPFTEHDLLAALQCALNRPRPFAAIAS